MKMCGRLCLLLAGLVSGSLQSTDPGWCIWRAEKNGGRFVMCQKPFFRNMCKQLCEAMDFETKERAIFSRYMDLMAKNATFRQLCMETFPVSMDYNGTIPMKTSVLASLKDESQNLRENFDRFFINHSGRSRKRQVFKKTTLNCPTLPASPSVPVSVHRLRPGDIKVVAAMGDSYTAGRGAEYGIVGLLFDFPGKTWSMGGDPGLGTMPNFLRKYNRWLQGFSTTSYRWWGWRTYWRFNAAVSGAESRHILSQAENLVQKLRDDGKVDMDHDWKVITLLVGGNDLCGFCFDKKLYSAENYLANIQAALDFLHQNVPRAFVNLVEVMDVNVARQVASGFICSTVHAWVCDCASNPESATALKELIEVMHEYRAATYELVVSGRYDDREDFTVVLQPMFRDLEVIKLANGEVDYSYWAADCFHPSIKGQETLGKALWNNMFSPEESKQLNAMASTPLVCPTEKSPYLYTLKNS